MERPGMYFYKISWKSEKEGKCTCIVNANKEEEGIEKIKASKWAKNCNGDEVFEVEEKMSIGFLPVLGIWE